MSKHDVERKLRTCSMHNPVLKELSRVRARAWTPIHAGTVTSNTTEMKIDKLLKKDQEWKIQTLLNSCIINNMLHYLIYWQRFLKKEIIWESAENLCYIRSLVKQFHIFNSTKSDKWTRKKISINTKKEKKVNTHSVSSHKQSTNWWLRVN